MKKIITIVIALFLSANAIIAQGTLQFSSAQLINSSSTVPAGKVWKVVSVLSGEVRYPTSGSTFVSNSRFIVVNGTNIATHEEFVNGVGMGFNGCCGGGSWMSNTGSSINSTTANLVHVSRENTLLPIWLPAGTTLAPGTNVDYISVIEFNIIP